MKQLKKCKRNLRKEQVKVKLALINSAYTNYDFLDCLLLSWFVFAHILSSKWHTNLGGSLLSLVHLLKYKLYITFLSKARSKIYKQTSFFSLLFKTKIILKLNLNLWPIICSLNFFLLYFFPYPSITFKIFNFTIYFN